MDVAPHEPDNWKLTKPFEPTLRNGKLYGRGAADLKGGLAAAFMAVQLLRGLEFEPRGDIIFESLVDEEFAGGNGTLAARLRGHNADLAVLTEPTGMELCTACLGALLGNLTIQGRAGMPYTGSSIPNPIVGAARAVELFSRWEEEWRGDNGHALFMDPGKELKLVLWKLHSGVPNEFTQMGIPLLVTLAWIVWCYPGMNEEAVYRRLERYWHEAGLKDDVLRSFGLELHREYHFVRPCETDPECDAVRTARLAYGAVTGSTPQLKGAPFSCDMALYGDHMPVVVLGPRGDNLHAPDEWVLVEDLITLTAVYAWLAVQWCG
jgi:acetylornithine deacetylase